MWRRAAMRSPLRSKRAMISPVRPRAKASGLTRIRVFDMAAQPSRAARPARLERRFGGRGLLRGGRAAPAARWRRGRRHLGLAERAQAPLRIERLAAARARLLEPAHAAGAAQVVAADL